MSPTCFLLPYGHPEVHLPSEVGTYFVLGLAASGLIKFLGNDSHGQ